MENWHELEFSDFIKELRKIIKATNKARNNNNNNHKNKGLQSLVELSKSDEMDWMELFENKKFEAQTIQSEIELTDQEIDQMVYELYGLTEEEIKIVEGTTE